MKSQKVTSQKQTIYFRVTSTLILLVCLALSLNLNAQLAVWTNSYSPPAGYNATGKNMVSHTSGLFTTGVLTQNSNGRKSLRIVKYNLTNGGEINSLTYTFGTGISDEIGRAHV